VLPALAVQQHQDVERQSSQAEMVEELVAIPEQVPAAVVRAVPVVMD
jgi:hypothetical protein